MSTRQDPYDVLGVERSADWATIRAAYRSLARRYHPDMPGGSGSRMTALNAAWSILRDPTARRAYDRRNLPREAPRASARGWTSTQAPPDDTVIDFGRYEGWSIDALTRHDPDYLEWLVRTPNGRRFRKAFEAAHQASVVAASRVGTGKARRPTLFARR